ncbi:hypothetical protein EBR66_06415 [bacterium]|nr:hypothetical protein [bacterium]
MALDIVGEGPEETFASEWQGCDFLGEPKNVGEVYAKFFDHDWYHHPFQSDQNLFLYGIPGKPWEWVEPPINGKRGKSWPCGAIVYNWDGGYAEKRRTEAVGDSWSDVLKSGGMVFGVAGQVLGLASKLVSEFAKNDYRKDMTGARDKFVDSQNSLDSAGQQLNGNAKGIDAITARMKGSADNLASIKPILDLKLPELKSMESDLNTLKSILANSYTSLDSAQRKLDYASNRSNFPPGMQGSIAQRNAIKQANAEIANISKMIEDYKERIYDSSVELKNQSDEYNKLGEQAESERINYQTATGQLDNALSERKSILDRTGSALEKRSESMADVQTAQKKFADKMRSSVDLASASIGATGASDAIGYIRTGEYFNAGGAILSSGANIFKNYYPQLTPYQVFIQSAIIDGMYTLQTDSSPEIFVRKFAESTLMLESASRLAESFAISFEAMDSDPYFAFQNLAVDTHAGVGIIGRWLAVASPFLPGGIVVSPLLPIATPVVQGVSSGAFATAVETGKKIADDKWSAKIGSGETSVLTTAISGIFLTLTSPFKSIFGGDNPAFEIHKMAQMGAPVLVSQSGLSSNGQPMMRFSVNLRPIGPPSWTPWPGQWWIEGGNLGGPELGGPEE